MRINVNAINEITQQAYITLRDVRFTADNIGGEVGLGFWVSYDEADKLAFQLSTVCQDYDRKNRPELFKTPKELIKDLE